MKSFRPILYLWTLPNTCLGLLFLPGSILPGAGVQLHTGVIEIWGGIANLFLRHFTLLAGGASAMTLGHVVIARDRAQLDRTRKHERVHVRQYERWGPFFLPAYLWSSLKVKWRGGDAYLDNAFEREAYRIDEG